MRKNSVLGIKKHRSAAVRGEAPGALVTLLVIFVCSLLETFVSVTKAAKMTFNYRKYMLS